MKVTAYLSFRPDKTWRVSITGCLGADLPLDLLVAQGRLGASAEVMQAQARVLRRAADMIERDGAEFDPRQPRGQTIEVEAETVTGHDLERASAAIVEAVSRRDMQRVKLLAHVMFCGDKEPCQPDWKTSADSWAYCDVGRALLALAQVQP